MEKISLVLLLLMTTVGLSAATSADWAKYNDMKSSTYNTITQTVAAKIAIAEFANTTLARADIAGWNYNNAAFVLINEFKFKTHYELNTQDIFTAEKTHRKALRSNLEQLFNNNIDLLIEAESYLAKARLVTSNSDVISKVASNETFIKWVKNFIAQTK